MIATASLTMLVCYGLTISGLVRGREGVSVATMSCQDS